MKKRKNILQKAVFLDRDGTINYDYGYVHKFTDFKFRKFVIQGLRYLSNKKYLLLVVTNQAGVAKGKFKIRDLFILNRKLKSFLKRKNIILSDIEYCPYHPDGVVKKYKKKSLYRKPGNLMIKKLKKKWNIDMKKSFMIGDKKSDKLAALKSGLYFEYAKKNFYRQVKKIDEKVSNNYL